ncbi:terminus macrodomain insulation protein YfbV [Alteromonadaceae bacterium BrNp21-10]|nr:terminus macrodomain insulation protein YfbV [Alteromonadaceae bacterium BrNp21-10]
MSQTMSELINDGHQYMQTWPNQKQLYSLFPECRVIVATKLAIKVMPALAVACLFLQINFFGMEYLPQAVAFAAFFISLPMQGLLWLGHRANKTLSPSMISWYRDIHSKMQQQGCQVQHIQAKPKYKELARLLKTAFDELDKVFTRQWF